MKNPDDGDEVLTESGGKIFIQSDENEHRWEEVEDPEKPYDAFSGSVQDDVKHIFGKRKKR